MISEASYKKEFKGEPLSYYLKQATEYVNDKDFDIMFVSVLGSQNYGLDNEDSDLDIRIIVAPTLNRYIKNKPSISKIIPFKTYIRENEDAVSRIIRFREEEIGNIEIKDLNSFAKCLDKGNTAYVETLFTPYYMLPDKWKSSSIGVSAFRNELLTPNKDFSLTFIKAAYYMMESKYTYFMSNFGGGTYNGKAAAHVWRLLDLMEQLYNDSDILNIDYEFSNTYYKDMALKLKNKEISPDKAKNSVEHAVSMGREYWEEFSDLDIDGNNLMMEKVAQDMLYDIIKNEVLESLMVR